MLRHSNKGNSITEAGGQLLRLNDRGIRHTALLMLGIAGAGNCLENAICTAGFLNATTSSLLWAGTLAVVEGLEMFGEIQKGDCAHRTAPESLGEKRKNSSEINILMDW